ncbi:kinase suppressor of Ras 2-like isoform X5 [Saccostrea echinata]|uniref:kinase suppressor of Ras 2-like isoform X5 n=1 Tax=Saccostrea echinata TaxID=191078 RepID=UPI002A7EE0CD|nr:kinase suppressor of Ras 2-like isoform X5 [Saccostrea echinata]
MSDSSDAENEVVEKTLKNVEFIQTMIDSTAKLLLGLRNECAATNDLTQNEIREQESKLLKLFSKQLVQTAKVDPENTQEKLSGYPKTDQWLTVVGLPENAVQEILKRDIKLGMLLQMSEDEVQSLLQRFNTAEEDITKLNTALRNLKLWTGREQHGGLADSDIELHWTQYRSPSSSPYNSSPNNPSSGRPSTSSETSQLLPTPPHSTPSSPSPVHQERQYRITPPATPPTVRPIQHNTNSLIPSTPPSRIKVKSPPTTVPMTTSKSYTNLHTNLHIKVVDVDGINKRRKRPDLTLDNTHVVRRPSNEDPHPSPSQTSPSYLDNNLSIPRSPKFVHRFKKGYIMSGTCEVCSKQIYFMGKTCKICKFKCHRDCTSRAPSQCLPDFYSLDHKHRDGSPSPSAERNGIHLKPHKNSSAPAFHNTDSGSNPSSCNSSTPSSPATMRYTPSPANTQDSTTFVYPEIVKSSADGEVFVGKDSSVSSSRDVVGTNTSDDSNKTLVDSNASEKTLEREDSMDSQDGIIHHWDRGNSLSVTLKEWDIPFEQLKLMEKIGTGRFGTVYKGTWHGQVAIKMLHMDPDSDNNQAQLSAFKLEVAMLKNTRHENLLLFMGACMKPPQLAIVTSYCSGQTLYSYVRTNAREKFNMNKTILIAQQIAQGMGYLHARGIIHKDLKTKNIFLENGKVVITDFGLFSVTKICHGNRKGDCLHISPGWLCYLSPEVIRCLHSGRSKVDLPFSEKSDVYAFGTIWYELLVGDWPFRNLAPECIIWQVGRGIKQSLGSVMASKEVKDVLMICWTYQPDDRPHFKHLLKAVERLPKKRLVRSPSHPVHLSRSVDSVFTA